MSLRQRSAQATAPPSIPIISDQPTLSRGNDSGSSGHPRRGIRLNRVLGRIVPVILLVYVGYAYNFVVTRYAFRYLYIQQQRRWLPILWLGPAHGLFFWSLRTYLRVFFAQGGSRADRRGMVPWLRARLGATFPSPDEVQRQDEKDITDALRTLTKDSRLSEVRIEPCQSDGQPIRCWRDSCNGRIKAFRTRHCGDCGTCRVGFDHHCAWFDNDVTAPATLRPFIGFLLSIPPLLLLGLGPLVPTAWRTLKQIHTFAYNDAGLKGVWWSHWYSWIGGPAFRWMVGFALGASRWSKDTPNRLPHESPRGPILIALGAMFAFVAIALATSSLTHLRHAKLTIDVERSKAFHKLQRQLDKLHVATDATNKAKAENVRQRMDALAPVQHFKVSWTEQGRQERLERIVAVSTGDGLLTHGEPWTNLRRFLLDSTSKRPAWSLSDTALQNVLQKASISAHTA